MNEMSESRKKELLELFVTQKSNPDFWVSLNFQEVYKIVQVISWMARVDLEQEIIELVLKRMLETARNLDEFCAILDRTGKNNPVYKLAEKRAIEIVKRYNIDQLIEFYSNCLFCDEICFVVRFRIYKKIRKLDFSQATDYFEKCVQIIGRKWFGDKIRELYELKIWGFLNQLAEKANSFSDWLYLLQQIQRWFGHYMRCFCPIVYRKIWDSTLDAAKTMEDLGNIVAVVPDLRDDKIEAVRKRIQGK